MKKETKICIKCKIEKELIEFGKYKTNRNEGIRNICKLCVKIQKQEEHAINKSVYRENSIRWKKNNKEKDREHKRNWKLRNPEKVIESRKTQMLRPEVKIKHNLRSRLRVVVKNNYASGLGIEMLGCSVAEFKIYLEEKFYDNKTTGEHMTWKNYSHSGWHIDHIIPLASAKNIDEIKKLCHYTNLQPLWAKDNLRKGSKIV